MPASRDPPDMVPIYFSFDGFKRGGLRVIASPPPEDEYYSCKHSLTDDPPGSVVKQYRKTQAGPSSTDDCGDVVGIRRYPIAENEHYIHRCCLIVFYQMDMEANRQKTGHTCPFCRRMIFRRTPVFSGGVPPTKHAISTEQQGGRDWGSNHGMPSFGANQHQKPRD
ncbi:hypothetical protein PMIN04_006175 [Paraphaeosphaeria minitans]